MIESSLCRVDSETSYVTLPQTQWEVTSAIMCRSWRILHIIKEKVVKTVYIYIPASSNGCCFNPTGWCIGTPYHAFSTPWKIQVYILYIHIMIAWLHLQGVWACCLPWWIECVLKAPCLCLQRLVFFGISFAHQSERMVSIVFWNVKDAWNWQTNKFRLLRGCWFQTSRVSPNVCQCEDTFKHTCITA